jgi:hypothetical protein
MTVVQTPGEARTGEANWVRERVVPTLMWGREDGAFHTRVHVANYYSLMGGDGPVTATALVDLVDTGGAVVAAYEHRLEPEQHLQLDLRDLVASFEGTIAVRLLPTPAPQHSHRFIGTLYFVSWFDDHGHVQFSHEQNRMTFEQDVNERTFLSPGVLLRPEVSLGFIVQNSYFGDEPLADDSIEVAVLDDRGNELGAKRLQLPARTSRVVDVDSFAQGLASHQTVALRVRGRHLNHPFTFVRHTSGDFSIHHF